MAGLAARNGRPQLWSLDALMPTLRGSLTGSRAVLASVTGGCHEDLNRKLLVGVWTQLGLPVPRLLTNGHTNSTLHHSLAYASVLLPETQSLLKPLLGLEHCVGLWAEKWAHGRVRAGTPQGSGLHLARETSTLHPPGEGWGSTRAPQDLRREQASSASPASPLPISGGLCQTQGCTRALASLLPKRPRQTQLQLEYT